MGCGEPDPCDVSTQDGRHIGGTQRNVGMELLQDGGEREEEEERGRSLKQDASVSVREKVFRTLVLQLPVEVEEASEVPKVAPPSCGR